MNKRYTIAVDFDCTLFKGKSFPSFGDPVPYAFEVLRKLRNNNHELLLWTCRKDESLQRAINALAEQGIHFDHYNQHPLQKHLSVKLDADYFIDDKALGCPLIREPGEKPYVDWKEVERLLTSEGVL